MEFIIPTDQEITFSDGYHRALRYTPVSFKNQRKGFRIMTIKNEVSFGGTEYTDSIRYVLVNDIPVEVDEDDVEMIMDNGEWKPYAKSPPVIPPEASQPAPEDTPAITGNGVDEPPPAPNSPAVIASAPEKVIIASEAKHPSARKWLYAIPTLLLCAAVGLVIHWLALKKK